MKTESLFVRLGDSECIERIVEEVASRRLENPSISARYRPNLSQPEKLQELKVHLARFLELGSGGPKRDTGREMRSAHTRMNISAVEYLAALDNIVAALEAVSVEEVARKNVLAIDWSLKGDIMHLWASRP